MSPEQLSPKSASRAVTEICYPDCHQSLSPVLSPKYVTRTITEICHPDCHRNLPPELSPKSDTRAVTWGDRHRSTPQLMSQYQLCRTQWQLLIVSNKYQHAWPYRFVDITCVLHVFIVISIWSGAGCRFFIRGSATKTKHVCP